MISKDEAARLLVGLGAAHDRIAAAMFAIDSHPGLAFLRSGGLAGQTASRAAVIDPEVDVSWAQFARLGDLLEQARGLCDQRRLDSAQSAELDRLVVGPVLAVDPTGVPVDGAGPVSARLRLGELAAGLERRCATTLGLLSEVDSSWAAVVARVSPLVEAVDALTVEATAAGAPDLLSDARARLAQIQDADLVDPLTAAPGGRLAGPAQVRCAELEQELGRVRRRVADLVAVRDGYPARREALLALFAEVAAAEQAVLDAYRRVTEKIADPGLVPPPAAQGVLRARLSDLDSLVAAGQWGRLTDALATTEASARRARDRAGELRGNAEQLLARRDELRGRLDAYRAKAARRGLVEDAGLSAAYQQAHDLLFSAPCDLRASTRAVFGYQQTLARLEEHSDIVDG